MYNYVWKRTFHTREGLTVDKDKSSCPINTKTFLNGLLYHAIK